jgi:hypothetical protein
VTTTPSSAESAIRTTATPTIGRRRIAVAAAVVLALAVGLGIRNGIGDGPLSGLGAAAAVLLAAAVAGLALSLPGKSPEGLVVGIGLPVAAMMAWTHLESPAFIWTVEGVLGAVLVVWTWRWWGEWRELLRLGTFWLAVPVWVLGTVSALATGHLTVAVQRVVYGGFALLVLLILVQAWWRRKRDVSVGLVAGFLLCHALILLAGADNLFVVDHFIPETAWGRGMADRFWGGPLLLYHPNFIAMTAVIAAMRIAPDAAFRRWQRWGTLFAAAGLLVITQSRTSVLIAGIASTVWFVLVIWREPAVRRRLTLLVTAAPYRRLLVKAAAPMALTLVVLVAAGGSGFVLKDRYADQNVEAEEGSEEIPGFAKASSGRTGLWGLIGREWRDDTVIEKVAGNADNPRGYILRYRLPEGYTGTPPDWYVEQPKLTADNAPVGALRRAGVLGVAVLLVGLGLVLWRATRRGAPPWFTITTFAMLASILTEDEVLNTAPAWAILVAGEIMMLASRRRGDTVPGGAVPGGAVPVGASGSVAEPASDSTTDGTPSPGR